MLYSATMVHRSGGFWSGQLLWCCIGVVVCLGVAMSDYQLLKKVSVPALALALVLLVALMIPGIGLERNGARRWLQLPGTTFQPSEFAKLAVIIALAHYCERKGRRMGTFKNGTADSRHGVGVVSRADFHRTGLGCNGTAGRSLRADADIGRHQDSLHGTAGDWGDVCWRLSAFAEHHPAEPHHELARSRGHETGCRLSGVAVADCAWLRRDNRPWPWQRTPKNSALCRSTRPTSYFP